MRAFRAWRPLALALLCTTACQYELSFKSVVFEDADYATVFEICKSELTRYYTGLVIRSDPQNGRLETDPVEYVTENGTRREQAYVDVQERKGTTVEVALMAPISRRVIDPDDTPPVRWVVMGSDVYQERRLLDGIIGEVLLRHPGARVVSQE